MHKAIVTIFALLFLVGTSTTAFAKKTPSTAPPDEVVGAMSNKLVRGVANIATGWVELPKQIVVTIRDEGVAKGIFVGPLKGIGMTIVRTISGAGEVATFYAPFPGFYEPYFAPEYVWQGWEDESIPREYTRECQNE